MFASLLRSRVLPGAIGVVGTCFTSISLTNYYSKSPIAFCDTPCGDEYAEWVSGYSPEGEFYFYNIRTGESTWTNPIVNVGSREDNHWYENWDFRAPKLKLETDMENDLKKCKIQEQEDKKVDKKKRVNHQIILIRHGEYASGGSDHERVLTARGREQALATGRRLQELVDAKAIYPVRYVYFSTMARATETHQLIQSQLTCDIPIYNINPCSMIREGAVCPPSPTHSTWKPSEEEFEKDGKRVEAAFAAHIHRADPAEDETSYSTVLVCHGNVIRYFILKALQLPVNAWLRTSVANCSISSLVIHSDGHVSLRGHGDCGHLSAKDITW